MELFDMVKAAPPPQTISAPERTSPPSPIPPDSPDAIAITEAADDDDLLESVNFNEEETEAEQNEDNNQSLDSAKRQIDSPPLAQQRNKKSTFKNIQKNKHNDNKINDARTENDEEDDDDYGILEPQKTLRQPSGRVKKTLRKSKDLEESEALVLEENDSDGSSDGGCPKTLTTAPTKTKAQQKMFSDLLDQSSSSSRSCAASEFQTREFHIRIRRLTQSEIDAASVSVAKSKFGSPGTRKRGRPRKSGGGDHKSPSPAKKPKMSPPKVHIKVPLQHGAKNRVMANLARTHTPPPILSSRLKSKPKPRSRPKAPKASPTMVRRYGKRFFNCVVNVKNLKWPSKSPERNRRRPRRSNLSVSFNESVEILGSGSRRSTFGPISFKSPKPTRLQRVDATGNVLEDIALTSNMLFTCNSPSASTSSGISATRGRGRGRGRGRRRICNGSPQLRRPHQRIPLSGLASLRLDDGPKSDDDDDDDEYIVPNELPGMQRPGTPTPRKKKISYTTTISDDEDDDDRAPPKKSKDVNAPKREAKTKPNQKKIEKSTSLKESVLQNVLLQVKTNEIVKEQEARGAADEDETEVEKVAETTNAETKKSVDIAEDKPQNGEKNPEDKSQPSVEANGEKNPEKELAAQTDVDAGETLDKPGVKLEEASSEHKDDTAGQKDDKAEQEDDRAEQKDDTAGHKDDAAEQKDDKAEQEDDRAEQKDDKAEQEEDTAEEEDKKAEKEENKAEQEDERAEEEGDKAEEEGDKAEQKDVRAEQKDDKAQQREVDDVGDFRELDTPPSQPPPPPTTEETPDDVLEIQTSLDDVRQLHTPFSSQQGTPPQAPKRDRRESGDSDCSFKSAHEPNKDIILGIVNAEGGDEDADAKQGAADAAAGGEDKSEIEPAAMAAVLTTPPPSTPRAVNGCDPARSDGSTITSVYYSPLEPMPTLDDEVLGQLVEPDFQLNSSRHAISRGTLDDIMTALES